MGSIHHTALTNGEVMVELGHRLQGVREAAGLTITETAQRAGLSRRTLWRAERGMNPTLLTVVRLLRAYGHLEALERFLPEREVSPMLRLHERQREAGG
jgi:transcriptional regulator with XRE-family HTH domain